MNGVYGAIGKGISYMVGGTGTDDVLFSTKVRNGCLTKSTYLYKDNEKAKAL